MKIEKVGCEQFAGVRDLSVEFGDGVNVVYGANEAGKSTLVNLISRTLFQNARLDKRRDREFYETYFPSAVSGGTAGDFIDGTVVFSEGGGTYRLTKEWGSEPRSSLSAPGGSVRDQDRINEILRGVLQYGEGVYTEVLFSSQSGAAGSLKALLDASVKSDARQDIADAVSTAFAESGGVSLDAISQAIDAKLAEIEGKHWDGERNMPQRRAGRWSRDLGSILKAYYELEDAQEQLRSISELEESVTRASAAYSAADAAAREAEAEFDSFNAFAGSLAARSELSKRIERLKSDIAKYDAVLEAWPEIESALESARDLAREKSQRELRDRFEQIKAASDELDAARETCAQAKSPAPEEMDAARRAQSAAASLENRLRGMNLSAALSMSGGHSASIRSLRTGEELDISSGSVDINEAVILTVPGVMELRLAPANVDSEAVTASLEENRALLSGILGKYGADGLEELEAAARQAAALKAAADAAAGRLEMLLGGDSLEEMRAAYAALPAQVRGKAEIDAGIRALCGQMDTGRFIAAKEAGLAAYSNEYGSASELAQRRAAAASELREAEAGLSSVDGVPDEYLSVADPMRRLERLQNAARESRATREAALAAKSAAESRLEGYKSSLEAEPAEALEGAQRRFDEQKTLLNHWKHIARVFRQQREQLDNSPLRDVADRFERYLGLISSGRDSSFLKEPDKLELGIYSAQRRIDYAKLSEGTKDTVLLAFRLAVLDHLFPDGGGVIVLDDPCADMDAVRAAQACRLIRDCAERHQVIFLTCREEYIDMLGGRVIRFGDPAKEA